MTVTTPAGMRRTADGRLVWKKVSRVRPNQPIPDLTLEKLTACAALGLAYWSDAPPTSSLWALDGQRQAHIVKFDRKDRSVSHRARCNGTDCGLDDQRSDWGWP